MLEAKFTVFQWEEGKVILRNEGARGMDLNKKLDINTYFYCNMVKEKIVGLELEI